MKSANCGHIPHTPHASHLRRSLTKRFPFLFLILVTQSSAARILDCSTQASLEDLVKCITYQMPQPGFGRFVEPTAQETRDWRKLVKQILQGNCTEIQVPSSLNGNVLIKSFTDSENGKSYCTLMEVLDRNNDGIVDHGYGTFIVNPSATRELNHAVPHPISDYSTEIETVSIFKKSNSRSFLMAGNHRFTSVLPSKCQRKYKESDVAHNMSNLFFATTQELNDFYGTSDWAQIQWHSMKSDACPDVNVYMTYGLPNVAPSQDSKLLALQSNLLRIRPKWRIDTSSSVPSCKMDGSDNTEGLYLNHVAEESICTRSASSASQKFIHIDQQPDYRSVNDWTTAIHLTWPEPLSNPTPNTQPATEIPAPPMWLYAISPSRGQVKLIWNPSEGATSYIVGRSLYPRGPFYLENVDGSLNAMLNYGLTPGNRYYYFVAAKNSAGTSASSEVVSAVAAY